MQPYRVSVSTSYAEFKKLIVLQLVIEISLTQFGFMEPIRITCLF